LKNIKKIACIYSEDGFDRDVLLNQIDFLKLANFNYIFTNKLIKCDLLIVTRIVNNIFTKFVKNNILSEIKMILFIDYSGQNCHNVFREIEHPNKYLITSRIELKEKNVFFGHPYVSINRWKSSVVQSDKKKYNCVHVGHYKHDSSSDFLIKKFNEFISKNNVHVFGDRWSNVLRAKNYHGKVNVSDVSAIYRNSKFAIGIKHPFQRKVAISGRYWHATLNGCALFVEDDYLLDEVPGLFLIDFNNVSDFDFDKIIYDSSNIEKLALDYWQNSNKTQFELLNNLTNEYVGYSIQDWWVFVRIKSLNFLDVNFPRLYKMFLANH
jgi:hypothetical protein